MNINRLEPNVRLQVMKLSEDEQFQKRFAEDSVLDYLQAQKHDKKIQFQQYQLGLFKRTMINGIAFKPITLALYGYLYCLQNNIIFDISKTTKEDLDLFFYLLQTRDYTYDPQKLIESSFDYGNRELGLNYNQMIYVFNQLYAIQFKVFSLFPRTGECKQPIFNFDWMLSIVAKIKPLTSYTTQQLYTQISVMEIYYYYAQYRRINGDNSIFVRSSQEILDEMDSRMIQLVVERLIQKKIIEASKKEETFDLMKKTEQKEEENKDGK